MTQTASDLAEADQLRRRSALGNKVRTTRRARGWTQEDLARETAYDRKSINRLETGAYSLSVDRLFVIAAALSVTAADLLNEIA